MTRFSYRPYQQMNVGTIRSFLYNLIYKDQDAGLCVLHAFWIAINDNTEPIIKAFDMTVELVQELSSWLILPRVDEE